MRTILSLALFAIISTALPASAAEPSADSHHAAHHGGDHAKAARAASPSALPPGAIFAAEVESLDQALAQARREGRRGVAVLFELSDCPECTKLRRTLAAPKLQRLYREHFVTVRLHVDRSGELRDFAGESLAIERFAASQRVLGTPTLIFFDLDGKPVARQAGGRLSADELLRLGHYVREAAYEDLPFHAYRLRRT